MLLEGSDGLIVPPSALARLDGQPAVWVFDPAAQTVSKRRVDVALHRTSEVVLSGGVAPGEVVVTAGVQTLRPGSASPSGAKLMIGPNLSAWAVARRSLIFYFMIVALIAGAAAFMKWGARKIPYSPYAQCYSGDLAGGSLLETTNQVTERIERKVQEIASVDSIRSFTRPGETTIFIDLKDTTPAKDVNNVWRDIRNRVGDIRHTMPRGVLGPFFNDDFGDTFGFIYGFVSDGFTHRELRDYVEDVRSKLLSVADVAKVEIIGAQDEEISVEFQHDRVAALGLDYPAIFNAIAAQNVVLPAGVVRTGAENVALQVSGSLKQKKIFSTSIFGSVIRSSV